MQNAHFLADQVVHRVSFVDQLCKNGSIMKQERTPLPIDPFLPDIQRALENHSSLVLTAEPGAGKTTRVPTSLLNAPLLGQKQIWVLQPRRIAAKMAAHRVAEELGEE